MDWLLYALLLLILIPLISYAYASFSFAPWVPCWRKDLKRIFKLANLRAGEIFYDLGCGSGQVVLSAARQFKARAVGIELALPLYLICQGKRLLGQPANVQFKWKNLFSENLSNADAVYFFGMPYSIAAKLKLKLERELKPGARVISYVFPIPGWQPVMIDKPTPKDAAIYLYTKR
ncbi:MAG: class I SAM-dependent methyltransferase [Patescibacteria group bacterium]